MTTKVEPEYNPDYDLQPGAECPWCEEPITDGLALWVGEPPDTTPRGWWHELCYNASKALQASNSRCDICHMPFRDKSAGLYRGDRLLAVRHLDCAKIAGHRPDEEYIVSSIGRTLEMARHRILTFTDIAGRPPRSAEMVAVSDLVDDGRPLSDAIRLILRRT